MKGETMAQLFSEVEAVVFDLDGTLYDSADMALWAVRWAIERLKESEEESDQELREMFSEGYEDKILDLIGMQGEQLYSRLVPGPQERVERVRRWVKEGETLYVEKGRASLFDGVQECLRLLKEEGIECFLASNCSEGYLDMILDHFKLRPFFSRAFCAGMFSGLTKAEFAARLPIAADTALMVGDRESDMRAGSENGWLKVGCLYGFGGEEELEDADWLIENPADLPHLLSEHGRVLVDTVRLVDNYLTAAGRVTVRFEGGSQQRRLNLLGKLEELLLKQGFADEVTIRAVSGKEISSSSDQVSITAAEESTSACRCKSKGVSVVLAKAGERRKEHMADKAEVVLGTKGSTLKLLQHPWKK